MANPIIMLRVNGNREVYLNRRAVAYYERDLAGDGTSVGIVMVTGERFIHQLSGARDDHEAFRRFWDTFDER